MRTKTFAIGAAVAVLIAAYAVAGCIVAPRLIRSALLEDLPRRIDVTPTVGAVHINPFLFQATVEDFALAGAHGEKLLGFRRLFVDFQLASLWHRAYTFRNIHITAPYVSAMVAKDGALNLLALRPKPTANSKPTNSKYEAGSHPLPAVRIDTFTVSRGLLTYEDRSRPDPFAARLEPIDFELRDFSTGVEGGRFTFTGASKLGERVKWHGHLSVDPLESDGDFQLDGLLAHTLWEYLQDQLNFVIDAGSINAAASYRFSLQDAGTENLQVDVSRVALTNLTVRPKEAGPAPVPGPQPGAPLQAPWITVPSLIVTGTSLDVAKRQAHVERVELRGLKMSTWRDADGNVNLQQLVALPTPVAPAAAGTAVAAIPIAKVTAPSVTSTGGATSPPWVFDLGQFDVEDASLATEDRTVQPAAHVLLAPLSLQVTGVSQDLAKPVTVALDARIEGGGSVTVSGDVTAKPALANLRVNLKDVELQALQPYIAQQSAMTLLGGTLGVAGKLHYGAVGKLPVLQFTGNVSVLKLHTVDDALQDDFINWDRLDILGMDYRQGPDRLDIDQIVASRLYARIIIESDASMNVKRVLKMPLTATARVTPTAVAANPRKSAAAAASPSMPTSIRKIVIHESQADFADFSVEPNFATGIQKLEGTVVALSSAPGSRAKVELTGALDTFSPVSITGDVNLLGTLYTDLTLSFRNISLPVLDPYSGKFAGYDIAKGKLSTELHYKVDGRKLDAQHHIVVEQLEFGEKTVSKEAVSLPVKLAVGLLKDRNGVIDLNIPVSGSLDDPEFRLGALFGKVLIDILEHAVTAPFELLGSLFGGGPDLQFIDFEPGIATLDAAGLDKANTVARALIERPQLKIDVPIAVVPDLDRPALRAAFFDAQLRAALAAGGTQKPGGAAPSFDRLDPEAQVALLSQLYARAFGAQPRFPETVTGLKSKSDILSAKRDFLSKAVRDHVAVGEDELKSLGQRRAMALKQALLSDPQVAAERVFLVANDKAVANGGAVRLELSLK